MKVKIKENINLKDLKENHWYGCRSWTFDFLKENYCDESEIFDVIEREDRDLYKIKNNGIDPDIPNDDYIYLPKVIFEEVKLPIKEMTVEEISEALGYEVKVVKERK